MEEKAIARYNWNIELKYIIIKKIIKLLWNDDWTQETNLDRLGWKNKPKDVWTKWKTSFRWLRNYVRTQVQKKRWKNFIPGLLRWLQHCPFPESAKRGFDMMNNHDCFDLWLTFLSSIGIVNRYKSCWADQNCWQGCDYHNCHWFCKHFSFNTSF